MKTKASFYLFITFLLCAPGIVPAAEQNDNPTSKEGWMGPKADLNKDGTVDESEKARAKEVWAKIHHKKEKMKAHADANKDGTVDETEKKQAIENWKESRPEMDHDNNPPGPKGGPGTNWENPAGPAGGPGMSPNPAGPKGGAGASPDRHPKK